MALSFRSVMLLAISPFILAVMLGAALWEIYQGQGISLALFSGIYHTFYFLATSIYFMLLFLKLWAESLRGAE